MALTKRYVTVTGAGSHDGTSEANAFSWAEMITDINTPRVGYKYLVKSGTYANGTTGTTLTGDGTTTSPNVIEGYNSTEGDLLANGRSSGGALNTTNFPAISYTGVTARFNANGSNYLVLRCLHITSAANNPTLSIGVGTQVMACRVTNTGTNSGSTCVGTSTSTGASLLQCDFETATTGASNAVLLNGGQSLTVMGCRIKCAPGEGIQIAGAVHSRLIANTIFECAVGISSTATNNTSLIVNNTVVNCSGDGIDVITGTTVFFAIIGNHITGNGGWGIDLNSPSTNLAITGNRLRDNSSGNINGGGDWEEGTSVFNVLTDAGSTATNDALDFTNQGSDDYSLLTTAAAITAGIGYRNPIGAHGAGSFGSGGGAAIPVIGTHGAVIRGLI